MLKKPVNGANLMLALQQNNNKIKEFFNELFKNKSILDKFSQSETGELMFDSKVINKNYTDYTDKEVDDAVDKILGNTNE